MWLPLTISLITVFLITSVRARPQLGMGVVAALALAFPVWIQYQVREIPGTVVGTGIDLRVTLGIASLVLYCFFKKSTYPLSLTICDLWMIGLLLIHLISDFFHDGPDWTIPIRAYVEWWVPYVSGRLAFQFRSDLGKLLPLFAFIAGFLAIVALIEGIFRFNLFEPIFGLRPPEQNPRLLERWGMKRAYGPTLNPIYFGTLQLLLLAWPMTLAIRAWQAKASRWWLLLPPLCIAGIIATGSRGPLVGLGLAMAGMFFCLVPRSRWILAILGCVAIFLVSNNWQSVLGTLEEWSNETQGKSVAVITDDGLEMKSFSSTRGRLLLFEVYKIALSRSGWLGFGTEAVTGFPVRVPVGPQEVATLRKIRFVDNSYILLTLRFGYLGLICFVGACVACTWQYFYVCNKFSPGTNKPVPLIGVLAATVGSCAASGMVVILSVWFPQDHGFVLLWMMGASSGLLLALRSGRIDG